MTYVPSQLPLFLMSTVLTIYSNKTENVQHTFCDITIPMGGIRANIRRNHNAESGELQSFYCHSWNTFRATVRCPTQFHRKYPFSKQPKRRKKVTKIQTAPNISRCFINNNCELNECWIPALATMHFICYFAVCYETGITVRAATAFTRLVIGLVPLSLLRFGIEKLYQVADAQNFEWLQKENPVQAVTPFNSQLLPSHQNYIILQAVVAHKTLCIISV